MRQVTDREVIPYGPDGGIRLFFTYEDLLGQVRERVHPHTADWAADLMLMA